MQTAGIILVAVSIGSMVLGEVLREIIDRRRVKRDGCGGTQDIAMIFTFLGFALIVAAIVCFALGKADG